MRTDNNGYVAMRTGGGGGYAPADEEMREQHEDNENNDNNEQELGMAMQPTKTASRMEMNQRDYATLIDHAESECMEYKVITTGACVIEDIPCDCWGALVFVIVKDLPDWRAGRSVIEGQVRLAFCFFAFALNYIIQGTLLFYIWKLLMLPGLRDAQNVYKDFHAHVWIGAGNFNATAFHDMSHSGKETLCGLALSQGVFLRVVLFLWVSTNVGEIRDNWSKTIATFMMPRLPDGLDTRLMVRDLPQTPESEFCVVCLNIKGKVGLTLLVWLPKFIIAFSLSFLGCLWLMAAENIGDLILNSLALAFVVKVDELIAMSFFPKKMIEDIQALCILLPTDKEEDEDSAMVNRAKDFGKSFVVLCFAMGMVQVIFSFQPVLPNYAFDVNSACTDFINAQAPWCSYWRTDCFPYGAAAQSMHEGYGYQAQGHGPGYGHGHGHGHGHR